MTWFKDDIGLVNLADLIIEQNGDQHSLTIPQVLQDDAGQYVAQAENQAGRAVCECALVIDDSDLPRSRLPDLDKIGVKPPENGPPKFTKVCALLYFTNLLYLFDSYF